MLALNIVIVLVGHAGPTENAAFSGTSRSGLPAIAWNAETHGGMPKWADWFLVLSELVLLPPNFDKKRMAQKDDRCQNLTLHLLSLVNQTYPNFFTSDVSERFDFLEKAAILTHPEAQDQHKLSLDDFEGRILSELRRREESLHQTVSSFCVPCVSLCSFTNESLCLLVLCTLATRRTVISNAESTCAGPTFFRSLC